MVNGFINLLKPTGVSSNYCISQLKKKLNIKKIGHLGTLDPDAAGVLPVCINKATKTFDFFLNKRKVYRAVFVFGKETSTLDSEGEVVKVAEYDLSNLEESMKSFIGTYSQLPPKFSAKKINGKNAYELARNGESFELQPKDVVIYRFDLISVFDTNKILVEIECSSGTYVRSLARDLAYKLNTVAYVGAIIRTASGSFKLDNAVLLSNISSLSVLPLDNVLKNLDKITLELDEFIKLSNGIVTKLKNTADGYYLVYCKDSLVGLCEVINCIVKLKINLKVD